MNDAFNILYMEQQKPKKSQEKKKPKKANINTPKI